MQPSGMFDETSYFKAQYFQGIKSNQVVCLMKLRTLKRNTSKALKATKWYV